jgi:hypothetical protein
MPKVRREASSPLTIRDGKIDRFAMRVAQA